MRSRARTQVDDTLFGLRTLQAAYDVVVLLERMAPSTEYELTTRALSFTAMGSCQALLTISDRLEPDTDYEVVRAIVSILRRVEATLFGQRSNSAAIARREVARAIGMLQRMDEIDWDSPLGDVAAGDDGAADSDQYLTGPTQKHSFRYVDGLC
jgi:hypothetical protein